MLSKFDFEPYYPHLQKFLEYPRVLYMEPFSTRAEPFTQWQNQEYSFLTDGFCHEKTFTAKVTAKTQRSVIKIKESIAAQKSSINLSDQVKLWFDLPNTASLYTKVKSNDYIKVHYDHGLRLYRNNYFYLFGGVNSTKLLNNVNLRLGVGLISENCNSENRLRINLLRQQNEYHWYHKTYLAYKRLRFGLLSVVNLNKCVIQKNNLMLGMYLQPETIAYLRAQVNGFRSVNPDIMRPSSIFDIVTASVIHRLNSKSKLGVQASLDIVTHSLNEAKVVYQVQYASDKIIKGAINNKLDISLLLKMPLYGLEDIGTLSVGAGMAGLGQKNTIANVGLEVSVNL